MGGNDAARSRGQSAGNLAPLGLSAEWITIPAGAPLRFAPGCRISPRWGWLSKLRIADFRDGLTPS